MAIYQNYASKMIKQQFCSHCDYKNMSFVLEIFSQLVVA
jgi:hypothetical protein